MKTTFNVLRNLGLVAAISALLGLSLRLSAADTHLQMKGAEHLQQLNSPQQAEALKTGDTVAMVCGKCKTVYVTRVKQGLKGAQILMEGGQPTELIGTHACAGCKSTIEVAGHGKGKEMVLKHSCKVCGDDSAFCCATKPTSGPTKGMENDKK